METLTEKFAPLLSWLRAQAGDNARDGKTIYPRAEKSTRTDHETQLLSQIGL